MDGETMSRVWRVLCGLWLSLACGSVVAPTSVEAGPSESHAADLAWVEEALERWEALSADERAGLARLVGRLGHEAAAPRMRECAVKGGAEASACVVALAALEDLEGVVSVREVLRQRQDAEAVTAAALVLGRWGDRLSYSLLNKAVLEGRGGDEAGVALVRAIKAIPKGPELGEYLEFHRRRAPSADARLVAGALLASARRAGPSLPATLEVLRETFAQPSWGASERWRARTAAWGVSRAATRGCNELWKVLRPAMSSSPERVEAVLGDLWPPCRKRGRKALSDAGLPTHAEADVEGVDGLTLPLPGESGPSVCEEARSWLALLTTRQSLWEPPGLLPGLERVTLATFCGSQSSSLSSGPWTVAQLPGKAVLALSDPPADMTTRTVDEEAGLYDEAFDDFAPGLSQPEWFPEHIELTIDDGPLPGFHRRLHKVLDRYGVKVSFFMCGVNIIRQDNANAETLKVTLDKVISAGHNVSYHSMNHVTKRKQHLVNMTAAQLRDDVELYRMLWRLITGKAVDVRYGRMPGGLGSFRAESRAAYHHAGLAAPVFWNAGPPAWPPRARPAVARGLACRYKERSPEKVIVLLHETAGLDRELQAFFEGLKAKCAVRR